MANRTHYRLGDVYPNPFRDMSRHPLNENKVQRLRESIRLTTFWDNIVARPREDGGVELAYGHHRLQALLEEYGENQEVAFIVRDLDDGTMVKMMANENDEEWSHDFGVTIESVRAVLQGYGEGKFELPPIDPSTPKDRIRTIVAGDDRQYTTVQIAEFLAWPEWRIKRCLMALDAHEEKILDADDLKGIAPTVAEEIISTARLVAEYESKPKARKKAKELADESRRGVTSRMNIRDARNRLKNKNGKQPPDINIHAEKLIATLGAFFAYDEFADSMEKLIEFQEHLDVDIREQLENELDMLAARVGAFSDRIVTQAAIEPGQEELAIVDAEFEEVAG